MSGGIGLRLTCSRRTARSCGWRSRLRAAWSAARTACRSTPAVGYAPPWSPRALRTGPLRRSPRSRAAGGSSTGTAASGKASTRRWRTCSPPRRLPRTGTWLTSRRRGAGGAWPSGGAGRQPGRGHQHRGGGLAGRRRPAQRRARVRAASNDGGTRWSHASAEAGEWRCREKAWEMRRIVEDLGEHDLKGLASAIDDRAGRSGGGRPRVPAQARGPGSAHDTRVDVEVCPEIEWVSPEPDGDAGETTA